MGYRTRAESLTLEYVLAKLEAKKHPEHTVQAVQHKTEYSPADKRKAATVLQRLLNLPERNEVVSIVPTLTEVEDL